MRKHKSSRRVPKPGRNEPCPCGSGKKSKHCDGAFAAADQSEGKRAYLHANAAREDAESITELGFDRRDYERGVKRRASDFRRVLREALMYRTSKPRNCLTNHFVRMSAGFFGTWPTAKSP